jgi:hypothetical protein
MSTRVPGLSSDKAQKRTGRRHGLSSDWLGGRLCVVVDRPWSRTSCGYGQVMDLAWTWTDRVCGRRADTDKLRSWSWTGCSHGLIVHADVDWTRSRPVGLTMADISRLQRGHCATSCLTFM